MCTQDLIKFCFCDHEQLCAVQKCAVVTSGAEQHRENTRAYKESQKKNRGCWASLFGSSTPRSRPPIRALTCHGVKRRDVNEELFCGTCEKIVLRHKLKGENPEVALPLKAKARARIETTRNLAANGQAPRPGMSRSQIEHKEFGPDSVSAQLNYPPPSLSKKLRGRGPRSRFDGPPGPPPKWNLPPNPPSRSDKKMSQAGEPVSQEYQGLKPHGYHGQPLPRAEYDLTTTNVRKLPTARDEPISPKTRVANYVQASNEEMERGRATERPARGKNYPPLAYRSPSRKGGKRSRSQSRSRRNSTGGSSRRKGAPSALELDAAKEFVSNTSLSAGAVPPAGLNLRGGSSNAHPSIAMADAMANMMGSVSARLPSKSHASYPSTSSSSSSSSSKPSRSRSHRDPPHSAKPSGSSNKKNLKLPAAPKSAREPEVPYYQQWISETPKFDSGFKAPPGLPRYAERNSRDGRKVGKGEKLAAKAKGIEKTAKTLLHVASDDSFVCADSRRVEARK